MLAVDRVSAADGRELAGVKGAKLSGTGSDLNIYPEGGETGLQAKAIFTDP